PTAQNVADTPAQAPRGVDESAPVQTTPSEAGQTPTTHTAAQSGSQGMRIETALDTSSPESMKQSLDKLQQQISGISNEELGTAIIKQKLGSSSQNVDIDKILSGLKSNNGNISKEILLNAGANQNIVNDLPSNANGIVSAGDVGQMYKDGVSSMSFAMGAANQPIERLGGGIQKSLSNSPLSYTAASYLFGTQGTTNSIDNFNGSQNVTSPDVLSGGGNNNISAPRAGSVSSMQSLGEHNIDRGIGAGHEQNNNLSQMAKTMTAPGNVNTTQSDIKQSVDSVQSAIEKINNIANQNMQSNPAAVQSNFGSIKDLAGGFAMTAPIQTATGELNIGNQNGFVSFGTGDNAVASKIPFESFKNMPPEKQEMFGAYMASSSINNQAIQDNGGLVGTNDSLLLQQIKQGGDLSAMDTRIGMADQIDVMEDLLSSIDNLETLKKGE
ncbi:hypothetical protein, partial [Aquamicrobium sp.]|uniref:hypothetical protein n=1 Tax=Aquamicrobium sp. TaxID=1872579 RepID=UPI0025890C0B